MTDSTGSSVLYDITLSATVSQSANGAVGLSLLGANQIAPLLVRGFAVTLLTGLVHMTMHS